MKGDGSSRRLLHIGSVRPSGERKVRPPEGDQGEAVPREGEGAARDAGQELPAEPHLIYGRGKDAAAQT